MRPADLLEKLAGVLRPWLGLAIVCAGFSLDSRFRSTFWTVDYLPNILQQAATNIIVAVGMTFVILTGGIDLSAGSVLAISGIALAMTVKTGPPAFLTYGMALPVGVFAAALTFRGIKNKGAAAAVGFAATVIAAFLVQKGTAGGIRLEGAIIAALAVGAGCGLVNGLIITLGRVPPFIVTLGMLTAARGLTVYATDGNSVSGLPPRLGILGEGAPLLIIAFTVVLFGSLILNKTRAGRYMRAIGSNEESSRLSGVEVSRYKTMAYVISGLTASIAAIVLTAKFQVASTNAATGAELNGIAAVVIGGTSLSGGRGTVVGSLVGALTIAILSAGLVIVGVKGTLQDVVIGGVIVLTVMIDQYRKPGPRG